MEEKGLSNRFKLKLCTYTINESCEQHQDQEYKAIFEKVFEPTKGWRVDPEHHQVYWTLHKQPLYYTHCIDQNEFWRHCYYYMSINIILV
jgi:hypothetical protein